MDYDFGGKVVVISGGSRGIGLATGRAFARAGASVAFAGRHEANVERARAELQALAEEIGRGGQIVGVAADLSEAEGAQRLVDATLERFDGADVLVNNVGAAKAGPFLQITDEMYLDAWKLKLLGAMRLTRMLVPVMERRGGGFIVNIAGTAGREPRWDSITTATTNAGMRAFTRGVAAELARRGIRINVIAPGKVRTERQREQAERRAQSMGMTVEQILEEEARETPTGRVSTPEEVAEAVLFLASGRVPNLVGVEVVVDGGVGHFI